MSSEDLITEAIDLLLEANKMFKEQAEERQLIYQKIIEASVESNADHQKLIHRVEQDMDLASQSNYFRKQKIEALNEEMHEIEEKVRYRDSLLLEIERQEANEASREELVDILQEYIDMEEAQIYGLVESYSENQEVLEELEKEATTFEILSANDPRIKAIEALQSHPEGISILQLSFMLGSTQYHANKIINELLELGLIERKNTLLKLAYSKTNSVDRSLLNLTV